MLLLGRRLRGIIYLFLALMSATAVRSPALLRGEVQAPLNGATLGLKAGEVPVGPEGREFPAHYDRITALVFSPRGKLLASASLDGNICFWDTLDFDRLAMFEAHKGAVFSLAFAPDGKLLASAGADHLVRLWDAKTRKETRQFRGHQDRVAAVAFSPDGKTLASGSYDKTIRLWDVGSGQEICQLRGHDGRVTAVAFSPDGKQLASGGTGESVIRAGTSVFRFGQDHPVRLWDIAQRKERRQLSVRGSTLAFSPDGKLLAVGAAQLVDVKQKAGETSIGGLSMTYVVDTATGEVIRQFNLGTAVAFSPDSKMLFLGLGTLLHGESFGVVGGPHIDVRLNIIELISGQCVLRLPDKVNPVAIAPDGNGLVAANWYKGRRYPGYLQTWHLARDGRDPAWAADKLAENDLEKLWGYLATENAALAYRAVCTLTAAQDKAALFLMNRLPAVPVAEEKRVEQLLSELDSEQFTVRSAACQGLKAFLPSFEPALARERARTESAEVRRQLDAIFAEHKKAPLDTGLLRATRTVEALERLGSPLACRALQGLAAGAPSAQQTIDARAALQRVDRRPDR